ncbi:hypothetical protein L0222_29515 [bacterium]|nr:hypothetical protein [bacterium]
MGVGTPFAKRINGPLSPVNPHDFHKTKESDCVLGLSICSEEKPCALHHYWKNRKVNELEFLKNMTLQHLCAKSGEGNSSIEVPEKKK